MKLRINKKQQKRSIWSVIYCGIIVIIILIILIPAVTSRCYEPIVRYKVPTTYDNWYALDDGKKIQCGKTPYSFLADKNQPVPITNVLPEIDETNQILFFRSSNQQIRVSVDGVEIYNFGVEQVIPFVKTPGNKWNSVLLSSDMSGKTIKIEAMSPYTNFSGVFNEIYLISEVQTIVVVLGASFWQMFLGFILVTLGIIFLIMSVIYHKSNQVGSMKYIGQFYIFAALWTLGESKGICLFVSNPILINFVTLFSFMLAPLAFLRYIQTTGFNHKKAIDFMLFLHVTNILCNILLQLFTSLDMIELLFLSHLTLIFTGTLFWVLRVKDIIYRPFMAWTLFESLAIFALMAGISLDIVHVLIKDFNNLGIATSLGISCFILFNVATFFRDTVKTEKAAAELKEQLFQNKVSVLLSQIKPHFLYNTLSTIRNLCDKDPKLAGEAVENFSVFLRGNMDSLTSNHLITFEQELEHTRNYLAIEKMRFGSRLTVIYDVHTKLFSLPTLILQPIVENAVRYGVGKKRDGVTIQISTRETQQNYVITVSDDGVGFNPSEKKNDGNTHIGISNVRFRLQSQCNGTLQIVSSPGEGTRVQISIPKKGEIVCH